MAISQFMAAINQLCDEKSLPKDVVIETVEAAIAAAYRKDYGNPHQVIRAHMDPENGQFSIGQIFEVVEEIEDEHTQLTLANAHKFNKKAELGDEIEITLTPHSDFGRIAAQTAKQVIIQRLREAEREMLYQEFKDKEHQLINGVVQQLEGDNVIINLGKVNGVMLPSNQIPNERYYVGQRLKILISTVEETSKGPRILVSRSDPQFISSLFQIEVPEIASESVAIKAIAREAGSRSKVAVYTDQDNLDPVGSCVGQRGTRVQAVLAEIGEEKIDIILWDESSETFIINALSPAKVENVRLETKNKKAAVLVPDDQLSLAIGRGGQNVRLASKLTGWSIDILPSSEAEKIIKKTVKKTSKVKTEKASKVAAKTKKAPKTTKKTVSKKSPSSRKTKKK